MSIKDWFSYKINEEDSRKYAEELAQVAKRYLRENHEFDPDSADLSNYQGALTGLSYLLCLVQLVEDSKWIDFRSAGGTLQEHFHFYDDSREYCRELRSNPDGNTGVYGHTFLLAQIEEYEVLSTSEYADPAGEKAFQAAITWYGHYRNRAERTPIVVQGIKSKAKDIKTTLEEVGESWSGIVRY